MNKSAVIETRIDVRKFADLVLFSGGENKTKSGIISSAINNYHAHLVFNKNLKPTETVEEAVAILRENGIEFKRGKRHRPIIKALQDEVDLSENEVDLVMKNIGGLE